MLATCSASGSPCTADPVQAAALWSAPLNLAAIGCTSTQTSCVGAGKYIEEFLGCYTNTCTNPDLYADASPSSYISASTAPMQLWNSDNEAIPLNQLTSTVGELHADCANYRFTVLPGNQHAESYSSLALTSTISFLTSELGSSPPTLGCSTNPPWTDAATAFDPDLGSSGEIVAFGGCCNTNGSLLNTTRVLTDGSWETINPSTKPPARIGASMAWDPALGEVVMFGGETVPSGYNQALDDTWAFNGTNWAQLTTKGGPPADRSEAALAYDNNTDELVLYGGQTPLTDAGNSMSLGDTWTLASSGSTNTWTEVETSSSTVPALYGASMATDPVSGDPILFGGDVANTSCDVSCLDLQNATYEWTGVSGGWTVDDSTDVPPVREFASMAAVGGSSPGLVLFGGLNGTTVTVNGQSTNDDSLESDTWTWQDGQWSNPTPGKSPPAVYGANIAASPVSGDLASLSGGFTGGDTLVQTTYGWTGSTWVTNP
jgi:hypothetical protein